MHPFAAVDAPEADWGLCQMLDGDAQAEHLVRHLEDKTEQAHQRQLHAPEREVVDEQRGAYVAAAAREDVSFRYTAEQGKTVTVTAKGAGPGTSQKTGRRNVTLYTTDNGYQYYTDTTSSGVTP